VQNGMVGSVSQPHWVRGDAGALSQVMQGQEQVNRRAGGNSPACAGRGGRRPAHEVSWGCQPVPPKGYSSIVLSAIENGRGYSQTRT
jgi:hypothetical protein